MSEGIQKVAGSQIRSILSSMTKNKFLGVLTGFSVTSIIQSSSATTVMIVSFVNAGLLNLRQAIGVIMGANIGTTMTAWIIVFIGFKFNLSTYTLPLIGIGVPLLFISKAKWRNLGEFIVGFALLFLGLQFLKDSVADLQLDQNIEFIKWISDLGNYGFLSTLLFIFIGTILTIIVQSSSAAMVLTLAFISEGGLPYEAAAAIILGENIGTTITANIAALIGNVHAKRAARAHLIFNLFGVLWMILIFDWMTGQISGLFNSILENSEGTFNEKNSARYSLALFHTVFNIMNTLILIWFVKYIEKLVIKLVPTKEISDEEYHLEYINIGMLSTPEMSVLNAQKEIAKYGDIVARMNGFVKELITEHDPKKISKALIRIEKYEDITDRVEQDVADYLAKISQSEMSEELSLRIRGMLRIIVNLERLGDIYYQMSKTIERKNENKVWFTPEQRNNILEMFKVVDRAFKNMCANLNSDYDDVTMAKAIQIEDEINELRTTLRKEHFKNVEKGEYDFKSATAYSELFNTLEKVGDHVINVTEGVVGEI